VSRSEHEHGEAPQQQVGQHRGHLSLREARLFFCRPVQLAGLVLPQVGELGRGGQEASLGAGSWAPA